MSDDIDTRRDLSDWISPNSPATPTMTGSLLYPVLSPLAEAIGIGLKSAALGASLLLGLLIVMSFKEHANMPQRAVCWVINSLLLFSVCLGIGISVDSPPAPPTSAYAATFAFDSTTLLGISSAQAQPQNQPPQGEPNTSNRKQEKLTDQEKARQEAEHKRYLEALKKYQQKWSW